MLTGIFILNLCDIYYGDINSDIYGLVYFGSVQSVVYLGC